MQLASPDRPPPADDVAGAVRAAQAILGARPVVTVLFPSGRQEQGMTSLAQWAAKGAHLVEADLLLAPGDALHLDAPLSWTSAAVCLAAWWAGVTITLDGDAEVAVLHASRLDRAPAGAEDVLVVGDGIDGAPVEDVDVEPWVRAVQGFPDQPPPPHADADRVALRAAGGTWTQRELLNRARRLAPDAGTLGVDAGSVEPVEGLVAATLRPLVQGHPTVVLRGVTADAAAGDRVTAWR